MLVKQVFNANDRTTKEVEKSYQYCPLCGTLLTRETSKDQRARCLQCGWVHYQNPAPGVVIVITEKDRVLLGKRARTGHLFEHGLPSETGLIFPDSLQSMWNPCLRFTLSNIEGTLRSFLVGFLFHSA